MGLSTESIARALVLIYVAEFAAATILVAAFRLPHTLAEALASKWTAIALIGAAALLFASWRLFRTWRTRRRERLLAFTLNAATWFVGCALLEAAIRMISARDATGVRVAGLELRQSWQEIVAANRAAIGPTGDPLKRFFFQYDPIWDGSLVRTNKPPTVCTRAAPKASAAAA